MWPGHKNQHIIGYLSVNAGGEDWNCEGETVPVHVMKAHRVSRGIAPLIPNLVNLTLRQLYPGKITPVPTEEEARQSELFPSSLDSNPGPPSL